MKKRLILWLFLTVLAACSLPAALLLTDSGKDRILIREEVLSGDPAEAAGILLRLPSHWGRRLLWDTEYTIGQGAAESSFAFSPRQVFWESPERKEQQFLFQFQRPIMEQYAPGAANFVWEYGRYKIIDDVAQRTGDGERHTETVSLGDYSPYHSLDLMANVSFSLEFEGDWQQTNDYVSSFFHIQTAGDRAEVTVERNDRGEIIRAEYLPVESDETVEPVTAAADGGQGVYLVYGLRKVSTGEFADRGQNRGIFYFPYEVGEKGLRKMDLTQVRKLQEFPEQVIPLEMLIEQEKGMLFLAVEEQDGFSLYVYRLEGEVPVPAVQIPVKEGRGSFCGMQVEKGGILLTWEDNSFSFVAEEGGEYGEWCRGTFPESDSSRENESFPEKQPFPEEQACLFDGERLTLAAYESWRSLNVLLAVYSREGQTYSGRYVHSGNENRDAEFDPASRLLPRGYREGRPEDAWGWGRWGEYDGGVLRPLEIFRRTGQLP